MIFWLFNEAMGRSSERAHSGPNITAYINEANKLYELQEL